MAYFATLPSWGATFSFGLSANDFNGPAKSITNDEFTMELAAGPTGSVLEETGSFAGLGINSAALLPELTDGGSNVFDVLKGSGPLAGMGEFIAFSFDKPGMLTGVNFDGVSDDALEYFILQTAGGVRMNFFDLDANNTVFGAVDAAVALNVVTGQVIYMLDDAAFNDEIYGLHIPFGAGEIITLTYAELPVSFGPVRPQNGARLQGLVVAAVPEPAAWFLAVAAFVPLAWRRRLTS